MSSFGIGRPIMLALGIACLLVTSANGFNDPLEETYRPVVDRHGILYLPADKAKLQGESLQLSDDRQVIENWVHPMDRIAWEFLLPESGRYIILVEYAAPIGRDGCQFDVEIAGQTRKGNVHSTGRADRYLPQPLMTAVDLKAGANRLVIRAVEVPQGFVMNLRQVRLVPAAGG